MQISNPKAYDFLGVGAGSTGPAFNSFSLSFPAQEHREIPTSMVSTPAIRSVPCAEMSFSYESTSMGIKVPIAAVTPKMVANPRDRPR
jgi:hypothetical protein